MKKLLKFVLIVLLFKANIANAQLKAGADRMNEYLPFINNQNVAVVANHTSYIGDVHLVDTLLALNVKIKAIFSPEHGFKGNASAGAYVKDGKYNGIPVVSLYGNNKKPTSDQLKGIDIVIFDIQDVGTRFYTYISTMTYVMEACAENAIKLIVLDRVKFWEINLQREM